MTGVKKKPKDGGKTKATNNKQVPKNSHEGKKKKVESKKKNSKKENPGGKKKPGKPKNLASLKNKKNLKIKKPEKKASASASASETNIAPSASASASNTENASDIGISGSASSSNQEHKPSSPLSSPPSPKSATSAPSGCENCESTKEVRIVLRQCGHITCLPCILDHLKHKIIIDGYPRIKCLVKGCNLVIHPNDINAVLDERESALEMYMPIENRRFLQYKQNKHSIYQGLPTKDIKRCPLCKAVYMKEPGCNYVICANSACDTSFCWSCENVIGYPATHYTTDSHCRLGYSDYKRLLTVVEMVLDVNFIVLWVMFPLIYLVAFLYIPLAIFFVIPITMVFDVWRNAKKHNDYMIPQEVFLMVLKMIFAFLLGAILTIPVAIGSISSGFLVVFLYMVFCFIRSIPCVCSSDRVSSFLCIIRWCGRLFKIGPYATLLDEAREGRKEALLKIENQKDDFENEEGNDISPTEISTNNVDETKLGSDSNESKNQSESGTRGKLESASDDGSKTNVSK